MSVSSYESSAEECNYAIAEEDFEFKCIVDVRYITVDVDPNTNQAVWEIQICNKSEETASLPGSIIINLGYCSTSQSFQLNYPSLPPWECYTFAGAIDLSCLPPPPYSICDFVYIDATLIGGDACPELHTLDEHRLLNGCY